MCLSVIFKFSVINLYYFDIRKKNYSTSKDIQRFKLFNFKRHIEIQTCLLNIQKIEQIDIAPDIQYKSQLFIMYLKESHFFLSQQVYQLLHLGCKAYEQPWEKFLLAL